MSDAYRWMTSLTLIFQTWACYLQTESKFLTKLSVSVNRRGQTLVQFGRRNNIDQWQVQWLGLLLSITFNVNAVIYFRFTIIKKTRLLGCVASLSVIDAVYNRLIGFVFSIFFCALVELSTVPAAEMFMTSSCYAIFVCLRSKNMNLW